MSERKRLAVIFGALVSVIVLGLWAWGSVRNQAQTELVCKIPEQIGERLDCIP